MFSIDIKILLEFIQKHWENTKIFSIFLLLLFLLINYFFGNHKIINETFNIDYYTLIFSICIIIVVLLIRNFTNILPKRRKDNLLILIAINTETEEEQNRLKNDFIHNLNEIVKSDEFDKYKIETLSKYHTIEACKDVKAYHTKTNAHFIIFGNCEKRYYDSKEKYILNLHASVAHRYVPYNVKNTLLKEMKNVFPHETVFSKQNEFKGFQIASETIGYATRYIMGLASLISYDPFTAFNIHHKLYNEINSASLSNPFSTRILNQLPEKILMECQYIIDYRFIKDKYKSIEDSLKYINTKLSIDKKDFQAHLMKGLYYFWFERNIKKAKIEINLCNGWEDKRWMYSRAFLYAYDGDLNEAYNSYKKVFRGTTGDNVPLDVVEFIDDILEIEPDKFQLNYCLGLIYFKYIKDYYLAKQYFEKFLKRVEIENKFNDQLPYVLKWLKIIENNNK